MNILSRTTAAVATLAAALLFNVPPAQAAPVGWTVDGGAQVIDSTHVFLNPPNDSGTAALVNDDLSIPITAPTTVSFNVDTQGATWCGDGTETPNITKAYPRVVVTVEGREPYSNLDDEFPCPQDDPNSTNPGSKTTQDDGRVSFNIGETGNIVAIHVEYADLDNERTFGTVEVSDLEISGQQIKWAEDPPAPQPCQGSACPHVATPYGATLSKHYKRCRVKIYNWLDQAPEGQWADPQSRVFITRVDGRVRANEVLQAGQEDSTRIHIKPHTGKRTVTVRTDDGRLLDRTRFRSGRCS